MGLRACVLAGGSSGNSIYIGSETTHILVDAGISARATRERLDRIGVPAERIDAICLSHEHNDHRRGIPRLMKQLQPSLYANRGTVEALDRAPAFRELPWKVFTTGTPFAVGDLEITAFSVPHDAYEPVGFVIRQGDKRIGIATDVGIPTNLIRERLRGCGVVILESNHDERLLDESPRPWQLKQRIKGRQGHLSNDHAARILVDIAGPHLGHVFLTHLSEDCNREELARAAVEESLARAGHVHIQVHVAGPDDVSPMGVIPWPPAERMGAAESPW